MEQEQKEGARQDGQLGWAVEQPGGDGHEANFGT
jgi:hypothetical protein